MSVVWEKGVVSMLARGETSLQSVPLSLLPAFWTDGSMSLRGSHQYYSR